MEIKWDQMRGHPQGLKWARTDTASLDMAVAILPPHRHRTIVQAGGHVGVFALHVCDKFQHVITLEPDSENFGNLVLNLAAHGGPANIQAEHKALGSGNEAYLAMVRRHRDGRGSSHDGVYHVRTASPGETGPMVPAISVDDLDIRDLDLLYLDVEGWELEAIRGAHQTITECRPLIACEVNSNLALVGWSQDDVAALLHHHFGYARVGSNRSDVFFAPVGGLS